MVTDDEITLARADIEATADLLARAMKLSGFVTTLFQERGFSLVVVGRTWREGCFGIDASRAGDAERRLPLSDLWECDGASQGRG